MTTDKEEHVEFRILSRPDLASMGWEPDLASMVDRVARFLSTEAKR